MIITLAAADLITEARKSGSHLLRGIAYAESKLNKKASGVKFDLDNEFIAEAAEYVMKGWPELIARYAGLEGLDGRGHFDTGTPRVAR